MSVTLAQARPEDVEALVAIQKQAFARLYEQYQDEASPYLRGAQEHRNWLMHRQVRCWKILEDGALCGGVTVFLRPGGEYYLVRLFVHPDRQGRGIAGQALLLCERKYPEARRWTLDFPIDQPANRRCYEKAGYRDTGVRMVKNERLTLAMYEKWCAAIRPLRRDELPAANRVLREDFADIAARFGLSEENCPTNGAFHRVERLEADWDAGCVPYGLFVGAELVGFMQLERISDEEVALNKLTVLPAHRRRGFGERLVAYAKSAARTDGAAVLTLGMIEENTELKQWYASLGFAHTGTKRYDGLPFTAGYMACRL